MALQYSAQTGMWVDPVTGQAYHDQAGTTLSTDPGLTDQSRRALGISNNLLQQFAQYGAQYNQARTGQQQLGGYLDRIINGSAPSVAGQQLSQGLGQIQSGLSSQASGATGENQPLAAYGKLQAYGTAAADANQQAAIQRTAEQNAAVAAKGGLLGQMAGQSLTGSGQAISGAGQFSGQAAGPAETQADIDQKNRAAWMQFIGNAAGGAAAAGAKIATA